jgi:type II secretory pathway pseudopilin PulG
MAGTAAAHASMTPMVLETVVAAALVAILVTVGLAVLYAVVAGSGAWALMLVVGLLRLVWLAARGAGRGLRGHLHRTSAHVRRITPETVPDLRVRPLG